MFRAGTLALACLAAGTAALGVACSGAPRGGERTAVPAVQYHCPMHPHYVAGRPGDCPICGMKLVPADAPGSRRIAYYRSPMDPGVRSDTPAKDAMGMDFVPVYEDELQGASVLGRKAVQLAEQRRQLLGVRSEPVRRARLERDVRTVGLVAVDERRVHHVHTKFDGYVEHLYVDFTGMHVKEGDHLVSIFSPELVATQQEYLLAHRAQQRLRDSGLPSVARGGADLLEAARQRLLFYDIRPEDIAELERTGQAQRTLDLHAELSGYVVAKTALHGMRVTPADTLFDIADLSALWVLADVYESDLPSVRLGMQAELTLPYLPGRVWRGPVGYVNPSVEENTRTVKVRIEVGNQGELLKPGMFADVVLKVDLGEGLLLPESAVIDSGDRRLVFLDRGDGRYEPREVTLGAKLPDGYRVITGVAEGDRVVTAANFLLDSESSLKAALSSMAAAPARTAPGSSPAAASPAPHY